MPVKKDSRTGKWRIGSGKAVFKTKKKADSAYRAYLARKHSKKK